MAYHPSMERGFTIFVLLATFGFKTEIKFIKKNDFGGFFGYYQIFSFRHVEKHT
jgi:hypothetical protein